jgi:16S rRNA (uracil1498-N3)-methyltransferase
MRRRLHIPNLSPGQASLPRDQAHHARDVLRLRVGDEVELFDDAGQAAIGVIAAVAADTVVVQVERVQAPSAPAGVVVASAVPKGDRADWLVEKLSELGCARWIPLRTARSVVHPDGAGKIARWTRTAVESAKQSRRAGVMRIDPLTPVGQLAIHPPAIVLSTRPGSIPLIDALTRNPGQPPLLLVGPEGGWTEPELDQLAAGGAIEAMLTRTVLRVETATLLAAGIAQCLLDSRTEGP